MHFVNIIFGKTFSSLRSHYYVDTKKQIAAAVFRRDYKKQFLET